MEVFSAHCSSANLKSTLIFEVCSDWLEKFRNLSWLRSLSIRWHPPTLSVSSCGGPLCGRVGVPTHFPLHVEISWPDLLLGRTVLSQYRAGIHWTLRAPLQPFEGEIPLFAKNKLKSTIWMGEWILMKKLDMFEIGSFVEFNLKSYTFLITFMYIFFFFLDRKQTQLFELGMLFLWGDE